MGFFTKLKSAMFGKSEPTKSPAGKLDFNDLAKVTRTGLLMGLATTVTYLISNVQPDMFGEYSSIATVAIALIGEISLRYVKSNGK